MAASKDRERLDGLPDEILLQIFQHLEAVHITRLLLVSRALRKLCLDNELWKRHCFQDSAWYLSLKSRRRVLDTFLDPGSLAHDADDNDSAPEPTSENEVDDGLQERQHRWQELQDMANWDPTFPGERISWYDEYVQRNAPACVNWFQTPRVNDRDFSTHIEARGLAIYDPYRGDDGLGTMLAVSPLNNGSVCLWDVKGVQGKQGSIVARSAPNILFDGSHGTQRSKRIDTGVTECVSVNSHDHKAFFAVQSRLIEVDLNRLDVVSRESFEWSISTLSPVHPGVPLTVGTSLGIHLHDFRARSMAPHEVVDRVDGPSLEGSDRFRILFDPKPLATYAPLSQPTPVSILHLPQPGSQESVSDDIYVGGRFTNILHYDRRKFPAIMSTIFSGAIIVSSLAALPYPFSTVDNEVRRQGEFTAEQMAERVKTGGNGRTLIAGGNYKTKGSLEIYGLSPTDESKGSATLQTSTMKNRQSAASAAILSVANHGSKIVFSDGAGLIKWFERDGVTECRRHRIGHSDSDESSSLFASMPGTDDIARKIVSTKSKWDSDRANDDNILFWTGEKLGMVTFSTAPATRPKDFEDRGEDEPQLFTSRMRTFMGHQADELRLMPDLGHAPQAE